MAGAVVLLLFTTCQKCKIKYPKNIKPIDWENYNDVYTVYWNLCSLTSEIKNFPLHEEIMVYGWIHNQNQYGVSAKKFSLVDDPSRIHGIPGSPSIMVENNFDEIQVMFDTCDLTKKCFVKGKLLFIDIIRGYCKTIEPSMYITDINNIYFE